MKKKDFFVFFIPRVSSYPCENPPNGRKNRVREARIRVNRRFYKGLRKCSRGIEFWFNIRSIL